MPVLGVLSYTLSVPSLRDGIEFYEGAGLEASVAGSVALFRCRGQDRECVTLIGGSERKRLHHVTLRADGLDTIAADVPAAGGKLIPTPAGYEAQGLWVEDPHGVRYHLREHPADPPLEAPPIFEINAPGRIIRRGKAAIKPIRQYPPVLPRRLGHVVLFSPDVMASVKFVTEGLGMGLTDHAQDVVAFTCARRDSDHHVLAFAKSAAIGFHHASFEVNDPDEVGRAGRALLAKSGRGDWGVGRHTVGSNYFHYIQDPWGSWLEFYSDMDHIDDYSQWTPTNYAPEDSLASWAPELPLDFGRNYEAEESLP